MANQFQSVTAPAGNGVGAAVDFSSYGANKTIIVAGQWSLEPTVNIEINNDPGQAASWQSIATFQGSGKVSIDVACYWIRARVSNFRGGQAPVISVGGTSAGALFATLVATAGDGAGADVDTSALGIFKTVQVSDAFRGSTIIEISNDGGFTWSQMMAFSAPGSQSALFIAERMRVVRNGVPLLAPGLPIINVGACDNVSGGGGGGIEFDNPITPPALASGTTNNYEPTGLDATNWIRQAVNADSSTLSGLAAPNAGGKVMMIENLGPSALILENEATTSDPENRFTTLNGADIVLGVMGSATLVYNEATERWNVFTVVQTQAFVNVRDFGATGDGTTDDRPFILMAVVYAIFLGVPLYFPSGRYWISKYIELPSNRALEIYASGSATVKWPSDNPLVVADGFATSDEMARSAFVCKYGQNVTIRGLCGEGGNSHDLDLNLGSFFYASNCVRPVLTGCTVTGGSALFVQDSQAATNGTGDSIAVNAGIVTLTDAAGSFKAGHVGLQITLAGMTNPQNNGPRIIRSVISATQVTYEDAYAVAETSSFRWEVDDSDHGAVVTLNHSRNQRGSIRCGHDYLIKGNLIERPTDTLDMTGIGGTISIAGTTVTLTDPRARWPVAIVGKMIRISGATSAGNNSGGANPLAWRITARPSATTLQFTNASGVAEGFTGNWWIANGDQAGLGNGVGALSRTGDIVTMTVSANCFTAAHVKQAVRIALATTPGNNGIFTIASVPAPNQVTFENTDGASEDFSGVWSVDSFDRSGGSNAPNGSTHAIYIQSGSTGRNNGKVVNNTIKGARTTGVKDSGSAAALRNLEIIGNTFVECGEAATHGADDSQEHSAWLFANNTVIDCGTQRAGASQAHGVSILGSRGNTIIGNLFHFTRNAIGSVDGNGISAVSIIHGSRYIPRGSQPLEDVLITKNKFTCDAANTSRGGIATFAISMTDVGTRAKWGINTATLTKSGSTMTLNDPDSDFHPSDAGKSITIVFAPHGGNNGTFTIVTANGSSLTYVNAGGTGGGVSAGTYRIPDHAGHRAGSLTIDGNIIDTVANSAVQTLRCVGSDVVGNTISNGTVNFDDDCNPRVRGTRFSGMYTQNAIVRYNAGCSWPILEHDNTVTNPALGTVGNYGVAVGQSSTPIDHPLLGRSGIIAATETFQQMLVPYGANWVDGDPVAVTGTTYLFKTVITDALTQFNSKASLIALIAAQADHDCVEFGTTLSVGIPTGHLLITKTTGGGADGDLTFSASPLNPQACPYLRNDSTTNTTCESRGSGNQAVIWTPVATGWGTPILVPNDANGMTLLAGSYLPLKNQDNGGCCDVVELTAGTPGEFRWRY